MRDADLAQGLCWPFVVEGSRCGTLIWQSMPVEGAPGW